MDFDKNDKENNASKEKDITKQVEIFIELVSKLNIKNIQELTKENKESITKKIFYINKIMNLYIKEKENLKSKLIKKNITNRLKLIRVEYLLKEYKNFKGINYNIKYKKINPLEKKTINNYFVIICLCFFSKVISLKQQNNNKKNIIFIYHLINKIFCFIGKLFLDEVIEINYFELIIKLFLTFVIKKSLESLKEDSNKNNEIYNLIFFKTVITLIKDVFDKIFSSKKKYTKKENELINSIIIFIHNNIVYSDKKAEEIKYNNKHFLCKHDCETIYLLDLYQIVLNTNSDLIINNYLNLLSDIYSFSFRYDNLMRPFIKHIEPLFINLNKKDLVLINEELNYSNFSLSLIQSLINKENKIISKRDCFIKEGFYLNDEKSGLIANIKIIENEFTIIFSFLTEKTNKEEMTLFTLVINAEKNIYIKYILRSKLDSNFYEIICEETKEKDKSATHDTKVNIEKDKNYIFAINMKVEGGLFKQSNIKTKYIRDGTGEVKNGMDVKIKAAKKENIKIYFGCNVNLKLNKVENNFKGFFGNVIVYSSKNHNIDDDNILKLKRDYKNIINLLLEKENSESYIFINNKPNLLTREKLTNKEIEKNLSLDNIKLIISPEYFKLLNYYDDIDYLNNKNYIMDNKITDEYFVKKKYIDMKIKQEPNDNEKLIIINTSFFDKNFHIFKNELTLNEFIKYDGIKFLSLLMEYYFQILNNIYVKKMMKETKEIKDICKKIGNNIFENLKFFGENILKNYQTLNINFHDINKYFYQLSITLLKFIEIEDINFDILNYLLQIVETLKNGEKNELINEIKIKVIEFILNPNFFKRDEINLDALYPILNNILKILKENLKDENFAKQMINEEYFNQLFSFLFLFDEIYTTKEEFLKNSRKIYKDILIESLKKLIIKKEENEEELHLVGLTEIKQKNSSKSLKSSDDIEKEDEKEKEKQKEKDKNNSLIKSVFEKLLEYKDNQNIFCILINICQKLNITQNAKKDEIIKILKKIIETKNREEKNTKNKILHLSIIYLVQIYLVDESDPNIKEKSFHSFIRKLGMNLDVIYALIASMNILKIEEKENKKEKIMKEKNEKTDDTLLNINLNALNEDNYNTIYIIKSIFEDIVYILNASGDNSSKKLLEVLDKNIFLITNSVKESQNLFFKEFFSSDSKICAEFFYFKWKAIHIEKIHFLDTLMQRYNILLKIYPNPFFFKLYFFIFKEVSEGINDEKNDKYKLTLLTGIIKNLKKFFQNKDEININMTLNLFNFALLLNLEYEKKDSLIFKNKIFQNVFYDFVKLLDISGALYSNYYLELGGNKGKVMSELIFDIYVNITDYSLDKKKFSEIFMKSNEKTKEFFSIFYFIDICKEKSIEKDKKSMSEIKSFIPHYENIIKLKNYFKEYNKNDKIKFFQGKSINKIEHVNLSIYILAKSFIYYKLRKLNDEFSKVLIESFLPLVNDDIYNLYTQKNKYYGNDLCKTFPLYYYVKSFIEANIIPDKNFKKYFDYINNELPMELKDEYNLERCYTSRLTKSKKVLKKKLSFGDNDTSEKIDINKNIKRLTCFSVNNNLLSQMYMDKNYNSSKNVLINVAELDTSYSSFKSNNESKLSSEKDDDSSFITINTTENINSNVFSNLKNSNNIILNGKKYFLQQIFAECFKDLLFNDNNFKKIKSTFLIKYRQYKNLEKETKQINYPVAQKNYSNSYEPKIFLKRDHYFYNKFYLGISHKYLNKDIVFKNIENIDFYHHIFKLDEKTKNLFCELATMKYISFGKIYFFDNYIVFKSEQEDPRDITKDFDTFIKYGISNKNKDLSFKKKFVIIYSKDIIEIIQRRTLLINNSIEIFMKNGKSFFFNFFRKKNIELAYQYINEINNNLEKNKNKRFLFCTNSNEEDIKNLVNSFKKGKISNSEYILKLNKYSTRTYNDTSQYPIFPWILKNYDDIRKVIAKLWSKDNLNQKELMSDFRDMNYPHSQQTKQNREEAIINYLKDDEEKNCEEEEEKFPSHWINHYSASAYIYYYLMRLNPYLQNFIKLQEEQLEDPNRTFNNFKDTEKTLEFQNDNRELIPDFFYYFDFLLNLNCNLFGKYNKDSLIDDFNYIKDANISKYINSISSFVTALLNNNKIVNNYFVSKIINNWVDIIFGPRQLPHNKKEMIDGCNIYKSTSYEQKTDIEKELKEFEDKIVLNQRSEDEENELMSRLEPIKINIINLGICPKQILDENIVYEGKTKTYDSLYKIHKFQEDKLIYFNYINDDNFIVIKDLKKNKSKTRVAINLENNKNLKDKEGVIYNLKSMNLMKEKNGKKEIQLYQYKYAFSTIILLLNKIPTLIALSCRYFDNYFRIQCSDKIMNIFYEDFVTSIKGRNLYENDDIFYTGLINGKLTEWKIIPIVDNNVNKNKKKVIKFNYNFQIKEKKYIYAHKSSISIIEIYQKQSLIITSGQDKYIYIRKIFDFELLTAINLNYSYGNAIVSQNINIFPIMLKVSELNLLFVLFYDYDKQKSFIRGYNLNGLFFAQTDQIFFKDNKEFLEINNLSFTKYSNLVVGFYNSTKIFVLNAGMLSPIWMKELEGKEEGKKDKKEKIQEKGNINVEFNSNNGEFHILKEHEIIFTSINDKSKLKEFDPF